MRKLLCFLGIHRYVDEGLTRYFIGGDESKLAEGFRQRCDRCARAKYEFIRFWKADQS